MSHLTEKSEKSEIIYDGKILRVRKDTVTLPNGDTAYRELIRHVGAVAIVALTDDGKVILERQFRNTFDKASRKRGVTGEILLQLIESRLDNLVFRFGIAPTRPAARQLVNHGHITVNGKVVDIPSYMAKVGDIIGVRERSKSLEVITNSVEGHSNRFPWLEWDSDKLCGKFMSYPNREDIPENINEQLIVELYSK